MEMKTIIGIVFVSIYMLIGVLIVGYYIKDTFDWSPFKTGRFGMTIKDVLLLVVVAAVLVPFYVLFSSAAVILNWIVGRTPLRRFDSDSIFQTIVLSTVGVLFGFLLAQLICWLFGLKSFSWTNMLALYLFLIALQLFERWRKNRKKTIAIP